MRIRNSLLNYITGLMIRLVTLILNFISRTIFINYLGVAYLGVNGLMTNVMSMLAIAELGIGTAISFSLYKPLSQKEDKKIKVLMAFYKKAYRIIGIFILALGLILMFFIDVIVKEANNLENLRLIFLLYIINTCFPYFINYRTILIQADQKEYKLAKVNVLFTILTVLSQIVVLVQTKSFIGYLVSNIIILFIQTVYINHKVTRMYPLLKEKETEKLPKSDFIKLFNNVKAMIFHKIGGFSIYGTDNIIISAFVSIQVVGYYSNYTMIINAVNSFITIFFSSLTASMGNLIATSSNAKKLQIFKITNFIAFWIYSFATICFLNLLNPTIKLWLGQEYILSNDIIWLVLINFFLTGMRIPIETVKSAAGLYDVDKYSPLMQGGVNLIVSILLVKDLGILGVFIGTLVSSLVLPVWQRPYLIYRHIFKTSSKPYFFAFIKYLLVLIGMGATSYIVLNVYFEAYTIQNYITRMSFCMVVPNLLMMLFFYRSEEFKEIMSISKSIIKGREKFKERAKLHG